jgi:V8-like Glu-specific endopeptidase
MKRISVVVTGLFAAILMLGAASAKTNGPPTLVNSDQAATDAFWTAGRLANAKPMPLPAASNVPFSSEIESAPPSQVSAPGGTPTLRAALSSTQLFTPVPRQEESVVPEMFGSQGLRFTSSRLVTDAVANLGGERTVPYSITGQLTFTIPPGTTQPPGNYVCSATVQALGVITTAGHCVSDGNRHFYTNWVFTPATRGGSAPFGKWSWRQVVTTNTWFTGGGGVPNAQDVAVIALNPNSSGVKIGNLTGFAGFNIPDLYVGQHVSLIGYPCNLDNCAKDHRTDAQVFGGSNNTDLAGSDMSGGASGGGWLINYGQYATGEPPSGASDSNLVSLVADTSYGPVAGGVLYLGASILDGRYVQCTPLSTCAPSPTAILNFICVHNPGYCNR